MCSITSAKVAPDPVAATDPMDSGATTDSMDSGAASQLTTITPALTLLGLLMNAMF